MLKSFIRRVENWKKFAPDYEDWMKEEIELIEKITGKSIDEVLDE